LWTRTRKTSVDEQLTVSTGEDRDISTRPQQNAYVAAELLDRNSIRGCCPSCCLYQAIILSEELARRY
jgi:hypothetical protein